MALSRRGNTPKAGDSQRSKNIWPGTTSNKSAAQKTLLGLPDEPGHNSPGS